MSKDTLKPDPLDLPKQRKGSVPKSGPLDTPPPIEDPDEAGHAALAPEAEADEKRDTRLPRD